jgi:hypothetical protein
MLNQNKQKNREKYWYQILSKTLISTTVMLGLVNCSPDSEVKAQAEDKGDLIISYEATDNEDFETIRTVLESTGYFNDLITDLNESLVFPNDINVIFTSCDESNAYYDPENMTITMCYELVSDYLNIFADNIETEEDLSNEVIDASSFTFFHELGHALVDQYNIPITGNEEDAVDNFAAIIMLDAYEDDFGALSGMFQFESEAITEQEDTENLAFWDEHSLSSQRFYNTACLIYGSNPEEFSFIVDEEYLPEDRAERCESEYTQKSEAWWTLINPFLK